MTRRAVAAENWRSNPWLRGMAACLPLMVLWCVLVVWFSLGFYGFIGALPLDAAYVACCVKAGKTANALRTTRQAEARRLEAESAKLRTLAAPNASAGQCPVCGMDDLDDLAADDRFMERSDRAKVVAYGLRRAHRDCAELVPYVESSEHFEPFETDGHMTYCACPRCGNGGRNRAYSRCAFCGFYQFGPSAVEAKAKLLTHVLDCPKRPRPAAPMLVDKSFRAIDSLQFNERRREIEADLAAVRDDLEEFGLRMYENRWMWPDLKGRRK